MRFRFISRFFVLLMCLALCQRAIAQSEYIEPKGWSLGMDIGETDLWGDVGTKSALDHYSNSKYTDKVCFMGGMYGRYRFHPAFALRFMFNYGTFYATDKWNYDKAKSATSEGDDAFQRYARNQTAKVNIIEPSVLMEFTPMRIHPESKGAHKRGQLFFAAGISYFHFTPYSTVGTTNTFVKTYDLHVEGQGFGAGYPPNYSLWSLAIPLAIGYRWDIGEHLNLGIEYMYRITMTDYLDGVSGKYIDPTQFAKHLSPKDAVTAALVADKSYYSGLETQNTPGNLRGNPSNKDSYSTLTLTFYYKVKSKTHEWWH